jgi:hypothetical protein
VFLVRWKEKMTVEDLKKEFLTPADEFTPIPFWFWNDALEETEIIRQIRDFKDKGVMGFIIHPRIGIPNELEYLSDRFMELVESAVKEAARQGMMVFLYDEGMYPSGSAHGLVVKGNPEFASRGLRVTEFGWRKEKSIPFELGTGETIVSVQALRKLEAGSLDLECCRKVEIREGEIYFMPPDSGNWSVLVFVETFSRGVIRGIHFGEDDWEPHAPPSADLLNPDAVAKFIKPTYDRYYEKLGSYFGTTIRGIFTDEPDPLGRRPIPGLKPWTHGFLDWYVANGGEEIDLPALWFHVGHDTEKRRKRFHRAIHRRLAESYYQPLFDWCSSHKVALTGHPDSSEEIGFQKYFHIPGQDLIFRLVAPEGNLALEGLDSTQAKCSSDAARHLGRRRNANECFACCGRDGIGWSLTAGDMKWFLDWLFVRGVNLIIPHAFYYSIRGERRSGERPPDVGPNNIWWPWYKSFSTYIKRMSWLMTDSINQARVAVLCEADVLPWKIVEPLYCKQIEFNYLEDSILESPKCEWAGGQIRIKKQRYNALMIEGTCNLKEPLRRRLQDFIDNGGTVIRLDGEETPAILHGVRYVNTPEDAVAELKKCLPAEITLNPPNPNLRVSHVIKEGHHFYLLANEGEECIRGDLVVGGQGRVEIWDPWRGQLRLQPGLIQDEKSLRILLQLETRESLILSIDFSQPTEPYPKLEPIKVIHKMQLNSGWKVHGDDSNKVDPLISWTLWPGMDQFSGTVTYEFEFRLDQVDPAGQVMLNLGEVHELAQVWINSQEAGIKMWKPYNFEISNFLHPGQNRIRVDVTNSLANKMNLALLPSGLLGPVTLEILK